VTESEAQVPRRRKKKPSGSSGKKKKSSQKNNVLLLRIGLFAGAAIVLLGGIFMMDWKQVARDLGIPSAHERMAKRLLGLQEEQVEILASIKDVPSAKAAEPEILALAEEMARARFERDQLVRKQKASREENRELREKYDPVKRELRERLSKETKRIAQIPGVAPIMADILRDATFKELEITSQLRKEDAEAGFNASGYSQVTDSTSLESGDRVEVLNFASRWEPGTVTDVASNGNVKVKLDIHKHTPNDAFDQYHPRNKLRIPD